MNARLAIRRKTIGADSPCFIIAEAGVNHNGSPRLAHAMIDLAAEAGADAIKFQTFIPEHVVSPDAPKAPYQLATTGGAESQLEMERKLALPFKDFRTLQSHAAEKGVIFLSSPFDVESVRFLGEIGVPAIKIPSGEVTHWALIRAAARLGVPIILSTGMSGVDEVEAAVEPIKSHGNPDIAILRTSNYPAEPKIEISLQWPPFDHFRRVVGYSDHTAGIDIALAAVARGAAILEKHFTLDRGMNGPDHRASLSPAELKAMILGVRRLEKAIGDGDKRPRPSEAPVAAVARRSLFAKTDISRNDSFSDRNVIALRPAGGIAANRIDDLIGGKARRNIKAGSMIKPDDIA